MGIGGGWSRSDKWSMIRKPWMVCIVMERREAHSLSHPSSSSILCWWWSMLIREITEDGGGEERERWICWSGKESDGWWTDGGESPRGLFGASLHCLCPYIPSPADDQPLPMAINHPVNWSPSPFPLLLSSPFIPPHLFHFFLFHISLHSLPSPLPLSSQLILPFHRVICLWFAFKNEFGQLLQSPTETATIGQSG